MIVERLRTIQEQYGYLPDAELKELAEDTKTPLYRLQEVASFFPHFRQEWSKPPEVEVLVCRDMSCHLRGADKLLAADGLGKLVSQTVHITGTSCLGRCDRAPAICVNRSAGRGEHGQAVHDVIYAGKTPAELELIVKKLIQGDAIPAPDTDASYAVHRNDWLIDVYRTNSTLEAYAAVEKLLRATPRVPICNDAQKDKSHEWLEKLRPAGLLGMGGAGAPAYQKWSDVWKAAGPEKYIVCNGDESEPGTFKDREILLHMPHLVVEGVILAGLLTNATAGYIYIRHEYPEQIAAVRREIERAIIRGACGTNIFESGRSFTVEIFVSPGGYICGEQSALLEAMEDRRAQPRNRPPELATNGLRDKPTVVNNVETIAWTPGIMLQGCDWYAHQNIAGCKGRRFFSISGDVNTPGVYEVPIGMTLGELINSLAGGMREGRPFQAIATSGPSGGLLPARLPVKPGFQERLQTQLGKVREESEKVMLERFVAARIPSGTTSLDALALPLDLNFFRYLYPILGLRMEMMLGAGLVVYSDATDLLAEACNHTEFYRNESCGKCVPCRIGSQKLVELGQNLLSQRQKGTLSSTELKTVGQDVQELARVMSLTSICGLGQVAPNPLTTYLEYFAESKGR